MFCHACACKHTDACLHLLAIEPQIKDAALNFLLEYLPTIKVDAIDYKDEDVEMIIDNLDMSGFAVPAERVEVNVGM